MLLIKGTTVIPTSPVLENETSRLCFLQRNSQIEYNRSSAIKSPSGKESSEIQTNGLIHQNDLRKNHTCEYNHSFAVNRRNRLLAKLLNDKSQDCSKTPNDHQHQRQGDSMHNIQQKQQQVSDNNNKIMIVWCGKE